MQDRSRLAGIRSLRPLGRARSAALREVGGKEQGDGGLAETDEHPSSGGGSSGGGSSSSGGAAGAAATTASASKTGDVGERKFRATDPDYYPTRTSFKMICTTTEDHWLCR
eukprot:scaffold127053_cov63-Phaeocystis_antarctica.AAC.2